MNNQRPVLVAILAFVVIFGGLTVTVIVEHGVDILTLLSLLILAMVGSGVVGALRQPPDE